MRQIKIFRGKEFNEVYDRSGIFNNEDIPFWNCFEFLGESVPQLLLALIFTSNNYLYIQKTSFIGVNELLLTTISMLFSIGSIAMGLYAGSKTWGRGTVAKLGL